MVVVQLDPEYADLAGNGKFWLDSRGFVRFYLSPAARCVPLHRWLMAKHIGRALSMRDVVVHADGDRKNNCMSNLKLVSKADSLRGKSRKKTTSMVRGVCEIRPGRWVARIRAQRKLHHLGTFDTFDEAVAAYEAALLQFGQPTSSQTGVS